MAAGAVPASLNARGLGWAALLTCGFMVAEAIAGVISGSLALIADAGHMLADSASLALAWLAIWMSRKPADQRRTYGSHRFQVLAAYSNGLTHVLHRRGRDLGGRASPARADAGAGRADAGGGDPGARRERRGVLRAAWRGARGPERARRDPARAGRPAGLGGGDRGGGGHPVDRLDADRSAAVGAGGAASSCAARGSWCASRGTSCWRARRIISTSTRSAPIWRRPFRASRTCITCMPGR